MDADKKKRLMGIAACVGGGLLALWMLVPRHVVTGGCNCPPDCKGCPCTDRKPWPLIAPPDPAPRQPMPPADPSPFSPNTPAPGPYPIIRPGPRPGPDCPNCPRPGDAPVAPGAVGVAEGK